MVSLNNPLISIVVPAYNYARFLSACIDSILAQTYPNWELIVVDNGSTDNTQEILAKYIDPRIRSFRIEINEGPVKAWALGYSHCRGDYFALLPADDLFLPTKLERQVQFLKENQQVNAVGTYIREIDNEGKTPDTPCWIVDYINQPIDYTDLENWRWKHYFCIPSALYSKELCDRANSVPSDGLNNVCDWDFHVRLLGAGAVFSVMPEVLTCYRWHDSNTSHKRGDANSQWVYSHLKNYIPALRRARPENCLAEIGNCITALYAAPNTCYFIDEISTPRRCANLEVLLDPEGGIEEFSDYKKFLSYSSNWIIDSENRAALAALDSAVMDLRTRLLSREPPKVLLDNKPLFPLEVLAIELQKELAKRDSIAWLIRKKCESLKRAMDYFAWKCKMSLQKHLSKLSDFVRELRAKD